ncbi:MAG: rRNA maturation RNase YbeY, partial [Hyphomicrobiaceae bacterium]
LSFPAPDQFAQINPGEPRPLGDVVLALETILGEAVQLSRTPRDHFTHLIVHGLLHLIGYDHIHDAEADEMEALETEILSTLGVSDPYAGAENPNRAPENPA